MVYWQLTRSYMLIGFLMLVLAANVLLYQPGIQSLLSIELESSVMAGSLIDLTIVAPIIARFAFRFSWKTTAALMTIGLVTARFLVPAESFEPYNELLYAGIAAEGVIVAFELGLLFILLKSIPVIVKEMNGEPALYAMLPAVEQKVGRHPLISILLSEWLMIYYAFFTWRKKAPDHAGTVTLHTKMSVVAMNIMLIHAIVIETIGIHWWLHEKSMILSFVLLVLNVYSVIFILAEIQAARLVPLEVKEGKLYVVQGLTKRVIVPIETIKELKWEAALRMEALQFLLKDFESADAQVVITLKKPVQAMMFMGRKKAVMELAIRVDEPEKLKKLLGACGCL